MLTIAQSQVVKNDIIADPVLNAYPNNSDGNTAIALAYDAVAAPDFWVWRTRVSKREYTNEASVDGTLFNWTGTGYIGRSAGERDAWRELFNEQGFVNPSMANVRQAVQDIFSGATPPAPANRTHLLTVSRRKTTRIEKLLATGTGSTASPATMGFEGSLTYQDVEVARNLP